MMKLMGLLLVAAVAEARVTRMAMVPGAQLAPQESQKLRSSKLSERCR